MPFIGLITDWRNKDYYLGALKGYIYSKVPDTTIIDINHTIDPYNIFQAAFVLKACIGDFPEGTVFIIGVKCDQNNELGHFCVKFNNRFIISSNNGFFALLSEEPINEALKLENINTTFPEKDIFAECACKICLSTPWEEIGIPSQDFLVVKNFFPMLEKSVITGTVMYIDNYGNAITNITKDIFEKIGKNRSFVIYPGNKNFPIRNISKGYTDEEEAELVALFNSLNLLEIANVYRSASNFINLEVKTNIRIQFYDT